MNSESWNCWSKIKISDSGIQIILKNQIYKSSLIFAQTLK